MLEAAQLITEHGSHSQETAMPPEVPFSDLMHRVSGGDEEAARTLFEEFARRLVCLAAARLPRALAAKVDPEDVVQSVFRSFFARYEEGGFSLDGWDSLWTVLTVLTVRKCGHRVRHFRAIRRDVQRESPPADLSGSRAGWPAVAPEPTPAEAVLLAETLEEVLRKLKPAHRPIVELRLQGYTVEEVSRQVGCTERTVYRVLDKVRALLEGSAEDCNAS
jgi:RNA polymerase sigma-70 factor (ECF subfamily)